MIMGNIKWSKSAILVRSLTVLMAYVLVLGDSSPFAEEEPEKDLRGELNASTLVSRNTSSLIEEGSVKNLGSDSNSTAGFHEDLCQTPGCIQTASAILKNMDPKVDPCDNFYRYACGGFLKSAVIPGGRNVIWAFTGPDVMEQLRTTIETESGRDQLKPNRLVKTLYKSCMNTTAIEAEGLEPLQAILKSLGGWPVLDGDSWNEDNFDWINSTYKLRDIGYNFNPFLSFGIGVRRGNKTQQVVKVSQPSPLFSFQRIYSQRPDDYYKFMVEIAVILGAEKNFTMKELNDSLRFQIELNNITLPGVEDASYFRGTVEELKGNHPTIPWEEFLSRILRSTSTVEKNQIFQVDMDYLDRLEKLISQTPKRVQANYAMWWVVETSIPYLNEEMVGRAFAINELERSLRWFECVSVLIREFHVGIFAMYAQQYLHKDVAVNVNDIVMNVKKQVARMFEGAHWMKEDTRDKAIKKVMSVVNHIGFPAEFYDHDILEKFYENLDLPGDNFFENVLTLQRFMTDIHFSKLREPYEETDWLYRRQPTYDSGRYYPGTNMIQISGDMLRVPYFSNDRPKYMNYAGIGTLIGHEIMHGFGLVNKNYDENGDFTRWWDLPTAISYVVRTFCVMNQYDKYTVEEVQMGINGGRTLEENLADNRGFKAAYSAYRDWAAGNELEPALPGINMTSQQMFWITLANSWCSKETPQAMKTRISGGLHAPSEFRIVGALSNMPEFAEDFNCPPGSKMNPQNKCFIW